MDVLGRRLLASIIDYLLLFILFTLFYYYCSIPLFNKFSDKLEIEILYETSCRQYADYKIEFGLEYLNGSGEQIVNDNATTEMYEVFANEQKVKDVYSEIVDYQSKLRNYLTSEVGMAIGVNFVIFFLISPIIFKNGRSPGMKIMGIALANKLNCKITISQVIVRFLVVVVSSAMFMTFTISMLFAPDQSNLILSSLFGFISFLSIIMLTLSKEKNSLADYFAATKMVNLKETLIFENLEAKKKFEEEISTIK